MNITLPPTITTYQQAIIEKVYYYVAEKLKDDHSGHDIAHIERVVKLAIHIQKNESNSDLFIIILSAYLHDVIDDKVTDNSAQARDELIAFMSQQLQLTTAAQNAILGIIDNMPFSKNLADKRILSLEGQIVQDADRLDALGAIGIGRTFYYGGNKKNIMYDPAIMPRTAMTEQSYRQPNTVINHFYEKLFRLKDQMNTKEGQRLAIQRHQILVDFVNQFEQEWLGEIE